jgi:MFS transporter, AAHS family, 4-hydroxybenzoate transporter
MSGPRNVAEIIDRQGVSGFQIRILILCAIALMLDGFDNQAIAYVAPALQAALHLRRGALGSVFTASVVGVALGSIVIGPFADRFGRTKILIFTLLFFAIFTGPVARSTNIPELMTLRFFAGLGLGAVIPLVIVLCSEYAPSRHRAKMVTLMLCGYATGAICGGFVAVYFVPRFGWASVFYIGATLPVFLAIALSFWMPESIRFLTLRPGASVRIAAILNKINPELEFGPNTRFYMAGQDHGATGPRQAGQLKQLFMENRADATLLLWACLFMNLIALNFLNNWLPTLVIELGVPTQQALRAATALQFGGICGIATMGFLADRFGYYKVLTAVFLIGWAAVGLIGFVGASLVALIPTIAVSGFVVVGSQMTLGALSATLYPTRIRATGSSWAFGVARLLSIVGPLAGGVMLAARWPLSEIFVTAAVPMLIAAIAVIFLARAARLRTGGGDAIAETDASLA